MKHLIFVYGSLKQGQSRNRTLTGGRYLGVASTKADYKMYKLSGYPALVKVESGTGVKVWGELWEVDPAMIPNIDSIEGVDKGLFERKKLGLNEVRLSHLPLDAEVFKAIQSCWAYTYFFVQDVGGAADCGSFWTGH